MSQIDTKNETNAATESELTKDNLAEQSNLSSKNNIYKTSNYNRIILIVLFTSLGVITASLIFLQFFGPNQKKPFGSTVSTSSTSSIKTESQHNQSSQSISLQSSSTNSSIFTNKYVEAVANGATQISLNTRTTPCGDLAADSKPWGFSGQVIEGPLTKDCLGSKYTWWKIKWGDNTEGWSIEDNLKFYDSPLVFNFGFIAGDFTFPSDFIPAQRACAKNIVTKTVYCTDQDQSKINPKTYTLAVPVGKYYVFASKWESVDKSKPEKIYYDENVPCGLTFDCFKANPNPKPIAVEVNAGLTIFKIDPTDWYVDEMVGGYYRDF